MSGRRNYNKKGHNSRRSENSSEGESFVSKSGGVRPKTNANIPVASNQRMFSTATKTKFSSEINGGIQTYERQMNIFQRLYPSWNLKRDFTISELKKLLKEVHEDQLAFNNTNLLFKEFNIGSRRMRKNDDSISDFVAALASLATDVVGGINSVAQACNVDEHMKKFGEMMDEDVENTKPLHAARSSCFEQYKNVEEIIRRYHSETFGSTWNKISKTLKTEEMCLELKNCSNGAEFSQIFQKADSIFRQMSGTGAFSEICKSIGDYVDSNPAVLDACESTGKALYGIYDTWGRDTDRNTVVSRNISSVTNQALIRRQESEISRLRSLVSDEETTQAKLESKINDAITDLESEALEMKNLYDSCTSFSVKKEPTVTYDRYRYYD